VQNAPPEPELLTDGSEPMGALLREIAALASSPLPILILGPTGCGKELVAREVHRRSGRAGPLVPVNCAALAEGLLESELFGHERGAFTGASRSRRGAVAAAHQGTLFLDEVADLPPRIQSMLLRVVQEREVPRVGSDRCLRVDVRFLSATNRPLEAMAAAGAFREDLLFRLRGAALRVPALGERRHEFPFLVPRLLARAAQNLGQKPPVPAPGLAQALAVRSWPGNVRELLSALAYAILRRGEGPLAPGDVPGEAARAAGTWKQATRDFQRRLLQDALAASGYRPAEAAQALGLARPALYATARRLGVEVVSGWPFGTGPRRT
jgi:two-component system, NtrC family, response regulator HydG